MQTGVRHAIGGGSATAGSRREGCRAHRVAERVARWPSIVLCGAGEDLASLPRSCADLPWPVRGRLSYVSIYCGLRKFRCPFVKAELERRSAKSRLPVRPPAHSAFGTSATQQVRGETARPLIQWRMSAPATRAVLFSNVDCEYPPPLSPARPQKMAPPNPPERFWNYYQLSRKTLALAL